MEGAPRSFDRRTRLDVIGPSLSQRLKACSQDLGRSRFSQERREALTPLFVPSCSFRQCSGGRDAINLHFVAQSTPQHVLDSPATQVPSCNDVESGPEPLRWPCEEPL